MLLSPLFPKASANLMIILQLQKRKWERMSENHKAGFVNIVGMPNAGKSTLMNLLVGEPLAVATAKAQTTRHRIQGIVNGADYQIVFSDTPGFLDPKYPLQEKMQDKVKEALEDADVAVLLIDASKPDLPEAFVKQLKALKASLIIAINKIDQINQQLLEKQVESLAKEFGTQYIIPISAEHNANVDQLLKAIEASLPANPPYFPKDQLTDRSERFFVAEIIRGQIFELYQQEVPYSCEVKIESFKDAPDILRIAALIFVNRKTQKPIIIGREGSAIKKLGIESRKRIQEFVQKQVYLEMHVKVRENWRENENQLKNFGYE